MSEDYRKEWCSYCEKMTYHEDGFCMICGKAYWTGLDEWLAEKEENDD
jgi:hypothetical protein